MKQPIEWDRRRFLQMAGSASLWSAAGGRLGWAAPRPGTSGFAYIGAENAIHVYSISSETRFQKRQLVSSAQPVAMAISNGRLYVANGVTEYGNLPRGSVEAYAIDVKTGRLAFINRAALSLSGTSPRDLVVAPNGRSVVVAVHGGGAYNVLTLEEDGRLGRVSGILKEIGSGPHPLQAAAHPSAVMFDREGRVLTADEGSDRLSVLVLTDGGLSVAGRWDLPAGSGPSNMVLHPDGRRVYVAHAFNGSVSSYSYGAGILDWKQTVWPGRKSEMAALTIHPSGEMLYSSNGNGVQAWAIAANGGLERLPGIEGVRASKLHATANGDTLLALDSDAVVSMKINAASRMLARPVKVASVSNPLTLAIL